MLYWPEISLYQILNGRITVPPKALKRKQQSGLKHLVISPTRMQNILDLAFANYDSVATKLEVTAVISDQDMVLFDLLVHALKEKDCKSGKTSLGTKTT